MGLNALVKGAIPWWMLLTEKDLKAYVLQHTGYRLGHVPYSDGSLAIMDEQRKEYWEREKNNRRFKKTNIIENRRSE